MLPFEIRAATVADIEGVRDLARYLNTVNLPDNADALRNILKLSGDSFQAKIKDPKKCEYLFVMRDLEKDRVIATSIVISQLGRRDAPYIYFDVHTDERYSTTLDKHFIHTLLSIGYAFNGPTEIGGLVLHPGYRRSPHRLGLMISYVRFMWIKIHRPFFRDQLLAELLPPLEPDGTSRLWEAVGRHFTGLTYQEADHLSKLNKEFIRTLFPEGDIYASMLSTEAQAVIGQVGEQTKGVEKMLRRVGFEYIDRVDPFDGGPHFMAPTDKVTAVQNTGIWKVGATNLDTQSSHHGLVAIDRAEAPYFLAVPSAYMLDSMRIHLPKATADHLGVKISDDVWLLSL